MEAQIKKVLGTSKFKATGQCGGGCINEGESYDTDKGRVFIKLNFKEGAKTMFEGEFASLKAIRATETIRAPAPLHVVCDEKGPGAALVMETLEMSFGGKRQRELGIRLAKMHDFNRKLIKAGDPDAVLKFGFPVTTCCGFLQLDNSWKDDWIEFFAKNRLEPQVKMAEEKYNNKEVRELWTRLEAKLPEFLEGIQVVPSLLHGDLWSGNKAELVNEPVIFDPACFYGHSEFDFGIINMFGGFNKDFHDGYHSILPKQPGFDNRCLLYELFHHLNHWNHFGSSYKSSTLETFKKLIKVENKH